MDILRDREGLSRLSPRLSPIIRHSRDESREAQVADPVHVIFYRVLQPGVVEVVRVLHERMEPGRHIGEQETRGTREQWTTVPKNRRTRRGTARQMLGGPPARS